jgi:hypothetical protein
MQEKPKYKIGQYRPIYFWAGPGTIRMNRLKFMQVLVDEFIHHSAHSEAGADVIVNRMHQNWIHLTYSWGFPPEVEQEDWDSFETGAKTYHQHGKNVFAYIQSSNCVYDGSFREKDWYVRDPQGRKHYYYSGRYMTCFQNRDWINYLKERIADAIIRGADGIFFDNLWYGCQPSSLYGAWLGKAGCFCTTCRDRYILEEGKEIPRYVDLHNNEVITYLHWRAAQLTEVVADLARYAREMKADIQISANDYDLVMRPSYLIYGIDFPSLAKIQDVTMIENFALPLWTTHNRERLANNALTIRNAWPFLPPDKHLSVISYDIGIGFDPVYPARRILQGMAEAAALGCSMTTKGTEYHDGKQMTLINAAEYADQQQAIGDFSRWLEGHQTIYTNRENSSKVALMHPADSLWQDWLKLAPIYFGAAQTLIKAGIPWKVIKPGDSLEGINTLLVFNPEQEKQLTAKPNIRIITVPNLPGWQPKQDSWVARHPYIRNVISYVAEALIRTYHANSLSRSFMDHLGMAKLVTQTNLYYLPTLQKQTNLLSALQQTKSIRALSNEPILLEIWQQDDLTQLHLVNYAQHPQQVEVILPWSGTARIITSGFADIKSIDFTSSLFVEVDIYTVCFIHQDKGVI